MIRLPLPQEIEEDRLHDITLIDETSDLPSRTSEQYKRAFDLLILLAAHVLLLPVFFALWIVIPLAIWLEDRGPVFYYQRRTGKGGRVFWLVKFRSMIADAEASTGPVWAFEHDDRVTRVGRFLRATALDELPQLINVLKGDLSMVGPRPERPELVEKFAQKIPHFLQRLQVKPGLTGVAQVYGRYSSLPRHKLHYDMLYIRKMSLLLDIKLLLVSVLVTVRARWQATDKKTGHRRRRTAASPR